MKFGIFDHVDSCGASLGQHIENRLRMVELYDRAGFHGYHVAEHHGTPLGFAPSPSVLMAAVAQRTKRIRFGPLVYILPLYHPLRLIEEVAMLDHMSGGRFMLGVGRGASPIETGFYGVATDEQRARYEESLEILLKGMSQDRLTHDGRFYKFDNVPMTARPLQQPHPELWYGGRSKESVAWAARNGINFVTLALDTGVREVTDIYRREWAAAGGAAASMPLVGVSRHIVVAASEAEAKATAQRAYTLWRDAFLKLWEEHGIRLAIDGLYPADWDQLEALRNGCAGTPEKVREFVAGEAERGGCNYVLSWFAFGDMSVAEVATSVDLFARHVMRAFN